MHICPLWTNGLYFGHQPDHCEKLGEARTFFSQWSPRISQQHGIANVMTTNHCENHVRFFSQWSGRMLPESEPCPPNYLGNLAHPSVAWGAEEPIPANRDNGPPTVLRNRRSMRCQPEAWEMDALTPRYASGWYGRGSPSAMIGCESEFLVVGLH